jgi:hypothetical protein
MKIGLVLLILLLTGCGTKAGYYLACGPCGEQWPECRDLKARWAPGAPESTK